jgi:hypothetical protein
VVDNQAIPDFLYMDATMLDCKPTAVATGEHADGREYIDVENVLYSHKVILPFSAKT